MKMNREIKFRAWGIDRGRMHDVHNIAFHESYGYKAITSEQPLDLHSTFTKKEEFILMQYTGLKDKNGVEIFEGDVYEDGDSKRHVVTFKNGGFGRVGRFLINYHTNESLLTHEPLINDVIDGCEVIGNIHENPELLEVES